MQDDASNVSLPGENETDKMASLLSINDSNFRKLKDDKNKNSAVDISTASFASAFPTQNETILRPGTIPSFLYNFELPTDCPPVSQTNIHGTFLLVMIFIHLSKN